VKIGILGCGVISGIYIETIRKFAALDLVAVADMRSDAARYRADQYGVAHAYSPFELLASPDVDLIVNLTPNRMHAQVGRQILEAGKHLYGEKPLTVYRDEAKLLLARAAEKGLRVGGAPDTFLGGAWQTARKAVDDGLIGQPFAAMACLQWRSAPGNGSAAPAPSSATRSTAPGSVSFFSTEAFKYGVTVPFDMGPYYLHALVNLLGPARAVSSATRKVFDEATRFGGTMTVESPTHVAGLLEFQNGAIAQVLFSSDVYATGLPHLELYGTEGSLRLPDPNNFPGQVFLRRPDSRELDELPCQHGYNQDSRGVGVADMAAGIAHGRPHRAAGEMAAHVVDIVNALHESADQARRVTLTTTCPQPAPLPPNQPDWVIPD
jgi:predicted dehydrogenase